MPRIGITMPPRSPWTGFDRVGNGKGRFQSGVGRLLGEGESADAEGIDNLWFTLAPFQRSPYAIA